MVSGIFAKECFYTQKIPLIVDLRNTLSNLSKKKYTYINFDFDFVGNRNYWKLIATYVKYVCQIALTKDADKAVVSLDITNTHKGTNRIYERDLKIYNYSRSENLIFER